MNTGKYNRRITIVPAGTLTQTTMGGFTRVAGVSRNTWCRARQLSMTEVLSYGLETTTAAYEFAFKYYSADDLNANFELTFYNRQFRIIRVQNIDEAKNEITVIANERTN
jgi:head-tail adaptor